MMQMLAAGGVQPLADGQRQADDDNPRGYFELEAVKQLKRQSDWLSQARGKAIKVVSQLLSDLPTSEQYRVIFLQRDLDEVISSQEAMLARWGRPAAPRERMVEAYRNHLERVNAWLARQANMTTHRVGYAAIVADPLQESRLICEFLGGGVDAAAMATAVDPNLYRNRRPHRH